jgi:AraC-like DNA-binding protein
LFWLCQLFAAVYGPVAPLVALRLIELIHIYLINEAKNRLRNDDQRVSEIIYALDFEGLSYFSRLFKKEKDVTPNQFKKHLPNNRPVTIFITDIHFNV